MRFEAKHAYFKGLAQSLGNFINLPHSLAMRHQHLQCYWSTNCHELPGTGLEVGPGLLIKLILAIGTSLYTCRFLFSTSQLPTCSFIRVRVHVHVCLSSTERCRFKSRLRQLFRKKELSSGVAALLCLVSMTD